MISYKDMTFCSKSRAVGENQCLAVDCPRYITPKLAKDANEFGLPLSAGDLSSGCSQYKPAEDE